MDLVPAVHAVALVRVDRRATLVAAGLTVRAVEVMAAAMRHRRRELLMAVGVPIIYRRSEVRLTKVRLM